MWCRWRCGVGVESPGGRSSSLLRCSQFLVCWQFQLSLFTSLPLPLIVICTIQDTRTGRIHLLYTYTWYLYLTFMQGMWAPHTVCTFARCPLLSTDLLRIENKTLDQISISMKTPTCGNHHMCHVCMCFLCCCKVRVEGYAGTKAQVLKKSQINCTCSTVYAGTLSLPPSPSYFYFLVLNSQR